MSLQSRRPNQALKANHVLTTAEAQEMLDRNAETIRDIVKLQDEAARPGGHPGAAARKEKMEKRLHRRLLKLARCVYNAPSSPVALRVRVCPCLYSSQQRWCDAPHPERMRSDMEQEQKKQRAEDHVQALGVAAKAAGSLFVCLLFSHSTQGQNKS